MNNANTLVLNWHITEACNYQCRYCYAAWKESVDPRELIHTPERASALLTELYQFFHPDNSRNPLAAEFTWESVRLNFAGGEPLLPAGKVLKLIGQARALGFEVSMISNGSHLDEELLGQLAPLLTWLGISIDSIHPSTNQAVGRIDRRRRLLDLERLAAGLERARRASPGLGLKVNTVVSQANHHEDFSEVLQGLTPDKWKVLRMLPVVNQDLSVSNDQFAAFIARHDRFAHILHAEDNQDMRESYLMVDPHGRFFQNSPMIVGSGYSYSRPILEVGAEVAFAEMKFDHNRYKARYVPTLFGSSK